MTTSTFDNFLNDLFTARGLDISPYSQRLSDFAEWVRNEVDPQAAYTDRYAPPVLETYDRHGSVVNRIVLNPRYEAQHVEVYKRGIIGLPYTEGAPHLLSFTMGYLLAQADISLHCPVTLTGAVAYVLAHHATNELRAQYLHDLTRMDGLAKTGGTWATELHGGSDVGATTTSATRSSDGQFRLTGLKWFTSNANSSLALATARPDGASAGSEGLGLYLVPSHLDDGRPNHYRIRRLKEKLGTKGLPTGEIELDGAIAIEVAPPPNGLRKMMEALEYSRIHNAVGAAGVQRRALDEATGWVKSRRAFGHSLIEYPMVQDHLRSMEVKFEASTLLAFEAATAFDEALKNPARRAWLRIVTALAKYLSAEDAIHASRAALELVGGNGYTKEFPAERLLRDAQVLTVWEGPANIQALELLRMLHRDPSAYEQRMCGIVQMLSASCPELAPLLQARLTEDIRSIEYVMGSRDNQARFARKLLHRLSQSLALGLLCELSALMPLEARRQRSSAAMQYLDEIEPPAFGEERSASVENDHSAFQCSHR